MFSSNTSPTNHSLRTVLIDIKSSIPYSIKFTHFEELRLWIQIFFEHVHDLEYHSQLPGNWLGSWSTPWNHGLKPMCLAIYLSMVFRRVIESSSFSPAVSQSACLCCSCTYKTYERDFIDAYSWDSIPQGRGRFLKVCHDDVESKCSRVLESEDLSEWWVPCAADLNLFFHKLVYILQNWLSINSWKPVMESICMQQACLGTTTVFDGPSHLASLFLFVSVTRRPFTGMYVNHY